MRPITTVATGLAYAALVALAACSGGGGGGNPTPTQTVTPSTPSPTLTPTPTPTPLPTATPLPVTITDSGSTNTQAFTIVLNFNGTGTITENTMKGTASVGSPSAGPNTTTTGSATSAHTSQFFADLATYAPMSSVPTTSCTKDASFGTTSTITWQGPGAAAASTSGDVSCPDTAAQMALYTDVQNVDSDFGVHP